MTSTEKNHVDWAELRQRVDSLSNAVFLLGGGAITVSASALISLKASTCEVGASAIWLAISSWVSLLAAIFLFILLKVHLVIQAYARVGKWRCFYSNVKFTNPLGFFIGILGLLALFAGLSLIVFSAGILLSA